MASRFTTRSKALQLQFDSKRVYMAGDTINGTVIFDAGLAKSEKIEKVKVKLRGKAETTIEEEFLENDVDVGQEENLVSEKIELWNESKGPHQGSLTFPFTFKLPKTLPPSMQVDDGSSKGKISYVVEIDADRKGLRMDKSVKEKFTVLPVPDSYQIADTQKIRAGWRGPWKTYERTETVSKNFWSEGSASLTVQVNLPEVASFPTDTDIPFNLKISTFTKPAKQSEISAASLAPTASQPVFPAPPYAAKDLELTLKSDVKVKSEMASAPSKIRTTVGQLGGIGDETIKKKKDKEKDASQPPRPKAGVRVMNPVWEPEKGSSSKGRWKREVVFDGVMLFSCPPSFDSELVDCKYMIDIEIPFPGMGNDFQWGFPINIHAGLAGAGAAKAHTSSSSISAPASTYNPPSVSATYASNTTSYPNTSGPPVHSGSQAPQTHGYQGAHVTAPLRTGGAGLPSHPAVGLPSHPGAGIAAQPPRVSSVSSSPVPPAKGGVGAHAHGQGSTSVPSHAPLANATYPYNTAGRPAPAFSPPPAAPGASSYTPPGGPAPSFSPAGQAPGMAPYTSAVGPAPAFSPPPVAPGSSSYTSPGQPPAFSAPGQTSGMSSYTSATGPPPAFSPPPAAPGASSYTPSGQPPSFSPPPSAPGSSSYAPHAGPPPAFSPPPSAPGASSYNATASGHTPGLAPGQLRPPTGPPPTHSSQSPPLLSTSTSISPAPGGRPTPPPRHPSQVSQGSQAPQYAPQSSYTGPPPPGPPPSTYGSQSSYPGGPASYGPPGGGLGGGFGYDYGANSGSPAPYMQGGGFAAGYGGPPPTGGPPPPGSQPPYMQGQQQQPYGAPASGPGAPSFFMPMPSFQ